MSSDSIAVIGGGAWGTALAVHVAGRCPDVRLWMREPELVARMLERRDNPVHLPGVRVPETVTPAGNLEEVLTGVDLVIAAVPAQFARDLYRQARPYWPADAPIVTAAKGIEEGSLELPLEVAAAELGADRPAAVLSGPSFAMEVAHGRPTAVVVASSDPHLALALQQRIASRTLRLYTNGDPVGVQLGGALKNVMAIAVGIADSLGLGTNAVAGLITRSLAELTRLVVARGGRARTASGLAGLGDLVLTCTGELSRNRAVGQRLGRGERLADILATSRSVAEGIRTTKAARALAARAGVDMPIVEGVYRILYEDGSPQAGLDRLLSRPLTSEEEPLPGDRT